MPSRINVFERETPGMHSQEAGSTRGKNLKPEVIAPNTNPQNTPHQISDC